MSDSAINYAATETAARFHDDNYFVKGLLGPVGCGKSVACMLHILKVGIQQAPNANGLRQTRWAVIRNTYPELKSTTLKTWKAWYPDAVFGKLKFDSPITQVLRFNDVEIEILFMPVNSEEDVDKLMSLELTGAYVNEAQFIPYRVFKILTQRVNRYPSKKDGAELSWSGVIWDSNPPDKDHWIYKTFEENCPQNYKLYRYKPPLQIVENIPANGQSYAISKDGSIYINSDVDYRDIQNDPNYWLNLVNGSTDEEIKVNLMGNYGIVMDGKPVHPNYNDAIHYANKILVPDPKLGLTLGFDFGLTPAVAMLQLTPFGQLQAIDELWTEDMDLRSFVEGIVVPYLDSNYPWWRDNFESLTDPAGTVKSQTDGKACLDILKECGIPSKPASKSNDPTPRRDALKYFLNRMVGGEPGFLVSEKCPMIRKGLIGGFQYGRYKVGGDERYHEKPVKNIYSHICEGLEYGVMRYKQVEQKKSMPKRKQESRILNVPFMAL